MLEELVALGDLVELFSLELVAFGKIGNIVRIGRYGKFWKIVRFGGIGRIGGTYQENW